MMHGDVTWAIPDGDEMTEFSVRMYEDEEGLCEESERRLESSADFASKINSDGQLLDGFALCSDYCFNTNPFFSPEKFDTLIVPYLKKEIDIYRSLGFYTIKHSDGNITPIIRQIAECRPDAIHSLDPQGGVKLPEIRKLTGDSIALIGNVNCGLLQTGSDEECRSDVIRSLSEGMERGYGYIFSTSNCAYTGLPLKRYAMMNEIRR